MTSPDAFGKTKKKFISGRQAEETKVNFFDPHSQFGNPDDDIEQNTEH